MNDTRNFAVMYYEDVTEKVTAILTAPLPLVTSSRANDLQQRIDLAVKVLTGEIHPGDAQVPDAGDVVEQTSRLLR